MTTSGESPEHLDGSDCVNHILEECSKAGDAELSWAFYVINYVVDIILILYYVNKYHSMLLKI